MQYNVFLVWTACGDSIVRAFDAKSGSIKRQFVGHEAAVNCMMITGGKLYTGSSDGTLRIWDAKDVSDEMMQDDGPPPPAPVEDETLVKTEDTPAEESEAVSEEVEGETAVEDVEEAPAEAEDEAEEAPADGDEAPEEETAEDEPNEAKEVDDIAEMEQELAATG